MSVHMGWLDRIVAIHFPNAKGLCFVSVGYGVASAKGTPPAMSATLSGLPYGGSYNLLGDIRDGPKPSTQTGNGTSVNAAMKEGLFQWSAGKLYNKVTTTGFGPTRIYYVTDGGVINAENYLDPYPGFDECGKEVTIIGAYGGTVFNCNAQLISQAIFAGYDPTKIVRGSGAFTTAAEAAYFAAAFNATFYGKNSGIHLTSGSFVASPPGFITTRQERVNFILNTGLIKNKKLPGVDKFTFTVNVSGDAEGRTSVGASVSKSTSFPLDSKNNPTFAFPDVFATDSGGSVSITGTIDVKANTVTFSGSENAPPAPG